MVQKTTQRIEIVRGTTNTFSITLTDANDALYTLASGEVLVFGIKKTPELDADPIVKKIATSGTDGVYSVTIDPADTSGLPIGSYWYDVGVQSGTKYFNIIKPSPFKIGKNVTKWGDGS